eukprot:c15783_g1_i1 orf=413-1261(-)
MSEIEHLSNRFGNMGRVYESPHRSNHNGFLYNSAHGKATQNGWDEDTDELEEEDVWGGRGTDTGWDHSYYEKSEASSAYQSVTNNGSSTKSNKGQKSWLSMELQAVGAAGHKNQHVGVGFAALEAVQNGGYGKESNGGWAPGFLTRKVKVPQMGGRAGGSGYGSGRYEHDVGSKRGGVMQSAPVSMPTWPAKYESNGVDDANDSACEDDGDHEEDDDDDHDDEGDGERGRGRRLAPHEIVDRDYARSQSTTFSVIEGAGRTLKGSDLRRVRNAVWSCIGFED